MRGLKRGLVGGRASRVRTRSRGVLLRAQEKGPKIKRVRNPPKTQSVRTLPITTTYRTMTAPLPFSQLVTIAQRAIQSQDGHTLALLLGSPLSAVTEDQAQVPLSILGALSNSTVRPLYCLHRRRR